MGDYTTLLDLFCGGGGSAVGYAKAGYRVTGVDTVNRKDYPFELIHADAMDVLKDTNFLDTFDVVHASPPCQTFTRSARLGLAQQGSASTVDLLTPTLALLEAWGGTWVVENVPGAPLPGAVVLCGSAFGLRVRRHRLFASNRRVYGTACRHAQQGRPIGVYHFKGDEIPGGGRVARSVGEAGAALGIEHMQTWESLVLAIPPAYTTYIGRQLLRGAR